MEIIFWLFLFCYKKNSFFQITVQLIQEFHFEPISSSRKEFSFVFRLIISVSAALKYSSLWTIVKTLKLYILKQKITFLSLSTYNSSDCSKRSLNLILNFEDYLLLVLKKLIWANTNTKNYIFLANFILQLLQIVYCYFGIQ